MTKSPTFLNLPFNLVRNVNVLFVAFSEYMTFSTNRIRRSFYGLLRISELQLLCCLYHIKVALPKSAFDRVPKVISSWQNTITFNNIMVGKTSLPFILPALKTSNKKSRISAPLKFWILNYILSYVTLQLFYKTRLIFQTSLSKKCIGNSKKYYKYVKKVPPKAIWADKKWAGFWQISLYIK